MDVTVEPEFFGGKRLVMCNGIENVFELGEEHAVSYGGWQHIHETKFEMARCCTDMRVPVTSHPVTYKLKARLLVSNTWGISTYVVFKEVIAPGPDHENNL
jgi:hypothetical protein